MIERSSKPLDRAELRSMVVRAGAPVTGPEVDRSAEALLRELALGERPRRSLAALLETEFGKESTEHHADRMKLWAGTDKRKRAEVLEELLGLGDALPKGRRPDEPGFPKIRSDR